MYSKVAADRRDSKNELEVTGNHPSMRVSESVPDYMWSWRSKEVKMKRSDGQVLAEAYTTVAATA